MSSHKYSENIDKASTHYLAHKPTELAFWILAIYFCQLAKRKPICKEEQLFNTQAFKYPAYHWEDP